MLKNKLFELYLPKTQHIYFAKYYTSCKLVNPNKGVLQLVEQQFHDSKYIALAASLCYPPKTVWGNFLL